MIFSSSYIFQILNNSLNLNAIDKYLSQSLLYYIYIELNKNKIIIAALRMLFHLLT